VSAFAGPKRCGLNYEVVRPEPNALEESKLCHLREQHADHTLCGHGCHWMDGWEDLEDWHPEDVGADVRCERCYKVLGARNARARGEKGSRRRKAAAKPVRVTAKSAPPVERIRKRLELRNHVAAQADREIAAEIRAAQDAGVPMREIADAMGMTRQGLYLFMKRVSA
jgi:hypothetical protein